jgi:signal transduction histidine kinase
LLLLALLLPALLAGWFAWHQHTVVLDEIQDRAQRSVIALEEHAANVLQTHSLMLRQVAGMTQGRPWYQIEADMQLQQTFASLVGNFKQVAAIGIADADGRLRASSVRRSLKGATIADRDYFIAHKNGTARGLFFGQAYMGRMNGVRQFTISIARTNASGAFDGVIFAAVPLDYFTSFWKQFAPSDGSLIPLIREDGMLLARYPAPNTPDRLNPNGPFVTHARHAPHGVYTATSQVDGVERINAYRQVKTYPLYISFSIETRTALQEWRRDMLPAMVMAAVAAIALVAFWLIVIRQSHQQRISAGRWRAIARNLESEVTRRENAEEALRQGQKMEAIGQLTGGIAHDFNNLLAGISGNLELMRIRLEQGRAQDVARHIDAAESVTDRAAALTHRLLAFSRRQTLTPKLTNVNELVISLGELIRGTVGPSIAISTVLDEVLRHTLCDPNQLENALLNLAINARDAMPDGGQLIIETKNTVLDSATAASYGDVPPGEYVTVTVTDTGCGMTGDVLRRAYDPFFTTKPIGQGTGLGLSMVHGFVRQSGGHIHIDSQTGKGTTVQIHLPMHFGEATGIRNNRKPRAVPRTGAGVTVLVVEDEAPLRTLIVEMLDEIGYTTLEAANGAEGMNLLQSSHRIDLLVSDIGLGGSMNGQQLAQAGWRIRPGLKVLFITGYAENTITRDATLGDDMQLISKPFTMEELLGAIAAMTQGS